MAGETSNTAEMARMQAIEMLGVFGWKKVGTEEKNWSCVTDAHKSEKDKDKKSHSTDIVFWYDDPYEPKRVYLNTDLKSYAIGSITKGMLKKELRSLAQTAECAPKSEEWQKFYEAEEHNSKVLGLLFIFNHDGKFDESFTDFFDKVRASSIKLHKSTKIVVFGPKLITYLASVANDLLLICGRLKISEKDCSFYYPELIRARTRSDQVNAATVEMLTGPWQIVRHPAGHGQAHGGYIIYYAGHGSSTDEFKYLIDYIFRYQLLREPGTIEIKTISASSDAASNFAKAKASYAEDFYGFEDFGRKEFEQRIERISFKSVIAVVPTFSSTEIGMK